MLGRVRDFYGVRGVGWWGMSDRQNGDVLIAILIGGHQNNGARPILHALFLATLVFRSPQVGITDDQTRNRLRERQGLAFHFMVKGRCFCRWLRVSDRQQIGIREIFKSHNLAVTFLQTVVLIRR